MATVKIIRYPTITADSLRKIELIEGNGEACTDLFFLTYESGGKVYERYTNVAGMKPTERTAVLSFIGRYARTQAIRKKGKPRRRSTDREPDPIDLDSLVIEMPTEE